MAHVSLVYQGQEINERDEMLSLTDMWRAAGSPDDLKPAEWRRYPRTEKRINHLATDMGLSHTDIVRAIRGGDEQGTWAHWALAIEYAEDLSEEMWLWAKTAIREKMEQSRAPIQTLPAVIATDTDLPRALLAFAASIDSCVQRQSGEIASIKTDVSALKTGQARIESRLNEIATRGRRKIKDSVKGEITRHTGILGGRCPCCGVRVVVIDGRVAPHSEFDHFYANSAPDADHVWLVCTDCHAELTRHVAKRDERNAEFQAFQAKRRRLPGSQLRLVGDVA
jgi:hypothetical protein